MAWHRSSSSERGYGAAWRRLRALAIRRDRGLCQPCAAQGRVTPFRDVDHITAKAAGGKDVLSNVQCICGECHDWKTAQESNGTGRRPVGADGWPL